MKLFFIRLLPGTMTYLPIIYCNELRVLNRELKVCWDQLINHDHYGINIISTYIVIVWLIQLWSLCYQLWSTMMIVITGINYDQLWWLWSLVLTMVNYDDCDHWYYGQLWWLWSLVLWSTMMIVITGINYGQLWSIVIIVVLYLYQH